MVFGISLRPFLIVFPALGLALGLAFQLAGRGAWAGWVWAASTVPVLLALLIEIVASLRHGEVGLDIVAALSMTAALVLGEELAAAVVAVMYAGGQYLESFAEQHARREMTALLSRVPRTAVRNKDGQLEEIEIEAIDPGDCLLIRRGDVVPVDGTAASGLAVLDQSALTGELIPVQQKVGEAVMSGSTNVGEAFDLVASRRAAESTYAGIVRLVETAQRSKAPMSRLADRFAIVFLGVTIILAGGAWFWAGDPIRAVAVLVVATPCPLILAVPVAIVSGLSRAAKHGILIKGGKALEMLARVRSLVIDKTGTLTDGRARVVSIHVASGFSEDEIVRFGASQTRHQSTSSHRRLFSKRTLGIFVSPCRPTSLKRRERASRAAWRAGAQSWAEYISSGREFSDLSAVSLQRPKAPGAIVVAVAIDGRLAGELGLADELRVGTKALLQNLRKLGIRTHRSCDRGSTRGGRCDHCRALN